MKPSTQAFAVPLILATTLLQGGGNSLPTAPLFPDTGQIYSLSLLPKALKQAPTSKALASLSDLSPFQAPPTSPHHYGPGDSLPRSYTIFGLQTGPGGMAFTDESGSVLMMVRPQIITGPFVSTSPLVPPPFTVPKRPQK
jgi:hypothetical protein